MVLLPSAPALPRILLLCSSVFLQWFLRFSLSPPTVVATATDMNPGCTAVRCNTTHVSFVCCGDEQPATEFGCGPKPQQRPCSRVDCRCVVVVHSRVNCVPSAQILTWTENDDLQESWTGEFNCRHPNFPNPHAVFLLKLRLDAGFPIPQEILLGLSKYNVASMELAVDDHSSTSLPIDFFNYFRDLRQLQISSYSPFSSSVFGEEEMITDFTWQLCASLGAATSLNVLTIQRVVVSCHGEENFRFLPTLQHVSIEAAAISSVPRFVAHAAQLRYLKIIGTNVTAIDGVLGLDRLKLLHLSHNNVGSLEGVNFRNRLLEELDLSHNWITSFDEGTFKSLKSLLYLDLSNNPIRQLAPHGFINLHKLRWLYLHHDIDLVLAHDSGNELRAVGGGAQTRTLQRISFQHLVGLDSLEFMSLACNANLHVDDDAFQLMYHLRTLDLKHCNLSRIPAAVGQLCGLQQLWLNFNALTTDRSVPPAIVAKLNHLRRLDLADNRFTENPNALFLIQPERRSLLLPLIVVLKQQLFWWRDACASHMWWLHLVQFGRNSTDTEHYRDVLRYGSRKNHHQLQEDEDPGNGSGHTKRRCARAYSQIIHRLMPFRALQRGSFCSRLDRKEQKSRNVHSKNMKVVMKPTTPTASESVDPEPGLGTASDPSSNNKLCEDESVFGTTVTNSTLRWKLAELHRTVDTLAYVLAGCIVLLLLTCIGCVTMSYRKLFRQ